MLELDPQLTVTLAIAACASVVVLLVLVLALWLRTRRLVRELRRAVDPRSGEDVIGALGRHEGRLEAVDQSVDELERRTNELREVLSRTTSRVGMVRYDAFEDMGGALSFSAALLDEHGHGIVMSAINGRTETRCYAKPVQAGASEHNLSAEEEAAIRTARDGGGLGEAPVPARRRRRSS